MEPSFKFNNVLSDFPIGIFDHDAYYPKQHHHIEYELFYLNEGTVTFCFDDDNVEVELHAGDAVFIQPDTKHYVKKIPDNKYHYYAIVFDSDVLGPVGDIMRDIFDSIRIYRFLKLNSEIIKKIASSADAVKNAAFGKDFFLKSVLFDVIAYVLNTRQYVEVGGHINKLTSKKVSSIENVLAYVKEHYQENINMDDVLEISSYSKSHFIRLFKKQVGVNLTEYINQYRVEKACLDLIYTQKNVTQIAMENGFNTVQYFSKIFRDYMKCTPKQYQKKAKSLTQPSAIVASL